MSIPSFTNPHLPSAPRKRRLLEAEMTHLTHIYSTKPQRWLAAIAASTALIVSTGSFAADWPQWRGPDRSGISKETGLLKEWPKEGPKLMWEVRGIGYGFSTPAIVGGKIYLLSNN